MFALNHEKGTFRQVAHMSHSEIDLELNIMHKRNFISIVLYREFDEVSKPERLILRTLLILRLSLVLRWF